MHGVRIVAAGLLTAAAAGLIGCGSETTLSDPDCGGSVTSASVQGKTVSAAGSFKGGQPIIVFSMGGTNHVYPASDYGTSSATFDVTGLPAGMYSVTWEISCDNGGEQNLNGSKVTSLTIP